MKFHSVIRGKDKNVKDICEANKAIKKYAYILHDKDPEINPHYHVFIEMANSSFDAYDISNWFDIPFSFTQVYLQPTRCSIQDELQYMLHSRKLELYKPSDIVANFDIYKYLNCNNL